VSRSKKGYFGFVVILLLITSMPIAWRMLVQAQTKDRIYDMNNAPLRPVAVVYGAAIFGGNRLSSVLVDRMDTAIKLYEDGVVTEILVSGDRRDEAYDEPKAMAEYARGRGVPLNDIIIDEGGKRTYDTCYRARYAFNFESAILVTQKFHLPRALFTCNQLGLESIGVVADRRSYRGAKWYNFRETAATIIALYDIIRQIPPTYTTIMPETPAH
jgi:SanA protein